MLTLALGKWSDDSGRFMGKGMIGDGYGYSVGGVHIILSVVTWIIVLAVLIALARWLWLKGDKEKKGK